MFRGLSDKIPVEIISLDESLKCESPENTPQTPLLNAILSGHPAKIEMARFLLENGADSRRVGDTHVSYIIKLFSKREFVMYPKGEQKEILDLLIEHGAMPDSRSNPLRCTDFHIITVRHLNSYYFNERQIIVDLLIEIGCNPRLKTKDGESVFDFAFSSGVIDVFMKHMTPDDYSALKVCRRIPKPRSLWALRDRFSQQDFEEILFNFMFESQTNEKSLKILIMFSGDTFTDKIFDRVLKRAIEIKKFPIPEKFVLLSLYLKNGKEKRDSYSQNRDIMRYFKRCDDFMGLWSGEYFRQEETKIVI